MSEYDPLRDYDLGMVTQFGVTQPDPQGGYVTAVAGIGAPVPVLFGQPAEWFTTYKLPGVNVKRMAVLPDAARGMRQFVGRERSTTTPNTWNVQAVPSVPVLLMYNIELAAEEQADMNALLLHVLRRFPLQGYGTYISVQAKEVPFRHTAMRNLTEDRQTAGRKFRYTFDYAVEGWLTPSLDCVKVPQILHTDVTVETHAAGAPLHDTPPPAAPPPPLTAHVQHDAPLP